MQTEFWETIERHVPMNSPRVAVPDAFEGFSTCMHNATTIRLNLVTWLLFHRIYRNYLNVDESAVSKRTEEEGEILGSQFGQKSVSQSIPLALLMALGAVDRLFLSLSSLPIDRNLLF